MRLNTNTVKSLWGEEFDIKLPPNKSKEVLQKINKEVTVDKAVKSKKVDVNTKIDLIREQVLKILGHYNDNTIVIETREQLH